jgi:hypothetical protein
MEPKFFKTQQDFRKWLEANHDKKDEIIVGFYKVGSGKPSMTWSEAVDQALCFGWIDGVRRKHGEDSYTNRFTPRRPRSIWSTVNIAKVAELAKKVSCARPASRPLKNVTRPARPFMRTKTLRNSAPNSNRHSNRTLEHGNFSRPRHRGTAARAFTELCPQNKKKPAPTGSKG